MSKGEMTGSINHSQITSDSGAIHIQSTSKECVIVIVINSRCACARGTVVVLSVGVLPS